MMDNDALQRLVEAATPGPWAWHGYPNDLKLATTHSGRRYVMDFVRKGFKYAQPRFQPEGRGMVAADKLLKFEVGDRSVTGEAEAKADSSVYRMDVIGVDCPDAQLIALAPTLAAEVIALRAQLSQARAEGYREAVNAAVGVCVDLNVGYRNQRSAIWALLDAEQHIRALAQQEGA